MSSIKILKKCKPKQISLLLAVALVIIAAGVLASTYVKNKDRQGLSFSQQAFIDNVGIPKSVQTKVNEQGKVEILVSAGEAKDAAARRIAVKEESLRLENGTIKFEVIVSITDALGRTPDNPRVKVILQEELPAGEYNVEVLLVEKVGNPVSGDGILGQETLTTTFRILE